MFLQLYCFYVFLFFTACFTAWNKVSSHLISWVMFQWKVYRSTDYSQIILWCTKRWEHFQLLDIKLCMPSYLNLYTYRRFQLQYKNVNVLISCSVSRAYPTSKLYAHNYHYLENLEAVFIAVVQYSRLGFSDIPRSALMYLFFPVFRDL